MKRLFLVIALAGAAGLAHAGPSPAWASLAAREARVQTHIDRAVRSGQVSRPEADRLRRQLNRIRSLGEYYRKTHGMTAWERRDVERRLTALDERIGKRRVARAKS